MNARTLNAYRAFRAGGGTPAGSLACARAEENARTLGAYVEWRDDWEIRSHVEEFGEAYEDGEPTTCEIATLYAADDSVLGSLGCVDDADAHYRRLVEAELFLEYLPAPGDTYEI